MTVYACLFEAKSIQDYILRSGRLRHVVGASELLDALTPGLLDAVIDGLGVDAKALRFSRRAGGAVYLFTDSAEARDAFRDLWALAVRQYAPGLEFVLATGEGENDYAAYQKARVALQGARNRQAPQLPAGTPVTRYAPRTGEPAVGLDGTLGLQDAATARFGQKRFWRPARGGLAARFAPGIPTDAWPRNLEAEADDPEAAFPFWPDNRYLGLLHADGNGLGALLQALSGHVRSEPDAFVPLFSDFSAAVSQATTQAAQRATAEVLLPARGDTRRAGAPHFSGEGLIPARPIVLGGDDLTILLRADLALPFARALLTAFEVESRAALAQVRARHPTVKGLPEALTAGAGIAFVKSSHPFHLAHELAEGLARHAKDHAKEGIEPDERVPPSLAFHRVTTACHGDYADILKAELTCGPAGDPIRTSLGAYGLDATGPLPALADLDGLAAILGHEYMARGPARKLLTLLGQDLDEARRRYTRWREVMHGQVPKRLLDDLDERLGRLCGGLADDLPISKHGRPRRTPLGDLAALLALTHGTPAQSATGAEAGQ